MAKKQTTRFVWPLVILAVLAVLIIGLVDPFGWRKPSAEEEKAQDPGRITLCTAQADDITAIEITKPGDQPFTLVKTGANWFIEMAGQRHRAEQLRVDNMLQDLPGLETDSLATDKPDQHVSYEVDDAHAVRLIVYTGDKQVACDLLVGKAAPGYQMAFVRKPGEDKVYRTSKNVKSLVGFAYSSFLGKQLWPFTPAGATSLALAKPDSQESAAFTRENGGFWQNADGGNGNQNALNELLQSFSELRVNSYVEDLTGLETGLPETPAPQLSVTAAEGTFSLELGRLDPEQNQYYVRDQDGNISLIGAASLSFLLEADLANLKMAQVPEQTPAAGDAAGVPGAAPGLPPAAGAAAPPPAVPAVPPAAPSAGN